MDYEKIYKDALERAQKLKKTCDSTAVIGWCEYIFPELKESEDEKIKNWIVAKLTQTCRNATGEEDQDVVEKYYKACAWLEKQGEQKSVWHDKDEEPCEDRQVLICLSGNYYVDFYHKEDKRFYMFCKPKHYLHEIEKWAYLDDLLEKQGEQKPTDKVESKFKDGQWIVFNGLTLYINEIVKGYYKTISIDGTPNSYDWDIDNAARLWTLNEAKDGDVLSYVTDEGDLWIMIYWSLYEHYEGHVHYHALLVNNDFSDVGTCCIDIDNLKPATTKQRDLLSAKMKEAGYKWDEEKKELIKNMTQLEIYKRQLEIATQMLENAKNHNLSSEDINKYQELYDLCKRSIEIYENNQEY